MDDDLLDLIDLVDPLDELFTRASNFIRETSDQYEESDLLTLYSLYKQATIGQCNTSKPNFLHIEGVKKWTAWNILGTMPKTEAKRLYIEKVGALAENWSEIPKQNWVVHSIEKRPKNCNNSKLEKNAFEYVKDGNLEGVKAILNSDDLHMLDIYGMGLIHWATDRNFVDILEYLISVGADVNFRDQVQAQTALHYAASCGHIDSVRVLLSANADRYIRDSDGQTCADVAEQDEIRSLLI